MTRVARYKKTFNSTMKKQDSPASRREDSKNTSNVICFNCRKKGHSVKNCKDTSNATGICYNCGSKEHSLRDCTKEKTGNLKYASCFVCSKRGHVASACPENANGLYPDGGGCRFCGSNQHLARNCNPVKRSEKESMITANPSSHGDGDDMLDELKKFDEEKIPKKKILKPKTKVINF